MTSNLNTQKKKISYMSLGIALGPVVGVLLGQFFFDDNPGQGIGLGLMLGILVGSVADEVKKKSVKFFYIYIGAATGAVLGLIMGLVFFAGYVGLTTLIGASLGIGIGASADSLGRRPVFTLVGAIMGAVFGTAFGLLLGLLHGIHAVMVGYGHEEFLGLAFKNDYLALSVIIAALGLGLGFWLDHRT